MRKLTFIMIMLFCASFTYAQKGKVSQASSYLSSGKLDEAKKLIDEAIAHENCVNDSKSWLVKGQIYQGIFESPLPENFIRKMSPICGIRSFACLFKYHCSFRTHYNYVDTRSIAYKKRQVKVIK